MGLLDIFKGRKVELLPAGMTVTYSSQRIREVEGLTLEELWASQPALRSVISFRARNVAQLGLHTFQRVDDNDRRRLRDDPVAALLGRPSATMTTYELIYDLISTLDLYDVAYWAWGEDPTAPSGFTVRPIPPAWVTGTKGGNYYAPDAYVVAPPTQRSFEIPADQVLTFHGWNPTSGTKGLSPVESLRQTLTEQIQAAEYRNQVWKRGGRVGTVIKRPQGADWGDTARERFKKQFSENFSGDGNKAGGSLLLEDGMSIERIGFSAREEQYVDAAKLAISTVASVYHVNPTMIGQLDNANFSNVREFRRMLYSETLGPLLTQIENRINTFLVPRLSDVSGVYVEFNIAEKLQGSFEEQAAVLSTSVGRPWMTANEARARNNMPALGADADELVTPLNLLVGGQASPRDSAPPAEPGVEAQSSRLPSVKVKARPTSAHQQKAAEVLAKFFGRQESSVRSALGAKAAADWWNEDRWNEELTAELYKVAVLVSKAVAGTQLEKLGVNPDEYDVDRTLAYLDAVSAANAKSINTATKRKLDAALEDPDDPLEQVGNVFEVAKTSRAEQAGLTIATALAGFASLEAVTQVKGQRAASKTWLVTSSKPRSSHAAMNGETVPIDQSFSNGAKWPGDSLALGVDDIAGCTCDLQIDFE